MTRDEALALVNEMRDMVGRYPGPRYQATERLKKIEFALGGCSQVTDYFREKVFDAVHWTGIWCSERRWRQWGAQLDSIVLGSLAKLERVIRQELLESVPAQTE